MSLRRPRSHIIGISNIDFRTKKDEENLKIFEPWQTPKDLGTMGNKNYKNPPKINKLLFSPTKRINTLKDLANDYPDPRYYATARFYKENNIDLKIKSILNTDRTSQLEEILKGKDVFTGDGMGIAEIVRKRKGRKEKKLRINTGFEFSAGHKTKINRTENLAKEKNKLNKNVILETQITRIDTKKTDNNLVDMSKIIEIRQALRKRYGNRTKTNKIFQQWARTFPNKITVYDAFKMINALNIPINYSETKALIASASNFGNEYLNIEEFSNLIFNKKENYYEYPWISKPGQQNLLQEKEQNNLKSKVIDNNIEINDNANLEILKDFLSKRTINFIKNLKVISKEKYFFYDIERNENGKTKINNLNQCNYENFSKTILSLNPPEFFSKEKYIKSLFNEYKDKDDLIDIKKFVNDLFEKNNNEFLTKLKDNISSRFKEQVEEKQNNFNKFISENKNKKSLIYQKKYDLDNQILLKKENIIKDNQKRENQVNEINSTVPSTPWIHKVYDKRNEHFNILNRVEHSLSAKPTIRRNLLKGNTRFGANPKWRNTAEILVGDEFSPSYLNEIERFNIDRDIGKDDKRKSEQIKISRQNRIKTAIQKSKENNYVKQLLKDEKDKFSQLRKCKRQYEFEDLVKRRNFLIE